MDAIPPIDWDRFATKDDIAAATILTKAEMELEFANVRTELRTGFANLRAEFAHSMRMNTFAIIGSLAALMTVFLVLTPLLR